MSNLLDGAPGRDENAPNWDEEAHCRYCGAFITRGDSFHWWARREEGERERDLPSERTECEKYPHPARSDYDLDYRTHQPEEPFVTAVRAAMAEPE